METYNIHETKTHLSQILAKMEKTGEEVIIGKAGKPIAKLSIYKEENEPRKLGGDWEGKVWIADDFDETPQEIIDSFYNGDLYNK